MMKMMILCLMVLILTLGAFSRAVEAYNASYISRTLTIPRDGPGQADRGGGSCQ